jgi:subtilisin family serine protease
VARFFAQEIPKEAFSQVPFERVKPEKEPVERPRERIHPLLKQWIAERAQSETEMIVINFRDDVRIPRFPEPVTDEPRDSAANKKVMARTQELVREITARRGESYQRLLSDLDQRYQAKVLESFWLVNAVLVKMPLGLVPELAKRPDVFYVEPEQTADEPPQNANNNDDVDDGRARVVSDPYFNLGLTRGWIGLLDTGMRFTHTQFNSPSHIAFRRDCVNGGANCNTGASLNPNDDCWNHGTSSAAIITANGNQGTAFRGVTAITLDSFKIYPTSFAANGLCNGGLNTTAAVRGFQQAVAVLDRVIVAEMQGSGNDTSTISVAADNAFDAGAVIIAANGNNGPNVSTVNTPANAHKVIGVGNFDVQSLNQIASQSRGPAPDNRFKPDIQTPTNTETASNGCGWQQNCTTGGSDTALRVFSGTSGATPYAAGAAALLRNWLRGTSFSIDPGQVYAQLILSGQQPYPFNNTSGAGPLRLPTDGWAWWGKVSVTDGGTIDIPLTISGGTPNTLDGALWWPETAAQQHNDIDLQLIDPGGTTRDSSISIPSVFERARVSGPVTSGTWKLRIRGFRVRTSAQTVYWAAHVRLR